MKKNNILLGCCLVLSLTSCRSSMNQEEEIIDRAYIHAYGPEIDSREWEQRGQSGKIVSLREDGVVITRSYEGGILHGEASYSFPHRDLIHKREKFDRGVLKEERWFSMTGIPEKQFIHSDGNCTSEITWFETGAPLSKEEYEGGSLKSGEYYNVQNQVESRVIDGKGIRTRRDAFGVLLSVDEIEQGAILYSTTYHANGMPESKTSFLEGVPHGERWTYYPNGEPHTQENWLCGSQEGLTFEYQDGEKYAEVNYVRGKKQGIEKRYRSGNCLVEEVSWVDGKRHGCSTAYSGDLSKVSWYVQDRKTNKPTYDAFERQKGFIE